MLKMISNFAFLFPKTFCKFALSLCSAFFAPYWTFLESIIPKDIIQMKYIYMLSVHYSSTQVLQAKWVSEALTLLGALTVLSGSSQMAFTTCSPAFSLFVYVLLLLPDWSYFRIRNILYLPNVPYTKEQYIKIPLESRPPREPSIALADKYTAFRPCSC